ncbi:unnamed protein product [Adineta steineri]|uniref:TIR domain-containing protein n=3 Tax=Adineta steineri TaxID=433720 RepID=A0A819QV65_9BILA|nr:unnamed protein product [Adineta steineri]CAF4035502.1 unnamed protein product [Adineta steineri]
METIEQVLQSFNSILIQYDENNNSFPNLTSIKELIQLILHSNEKYFYESDFLNHRLFSILRDWYLKFLRHWRLGTQSNDDEFYFVFDTIPNLFVKMSNHISEKNILILKELIFHKSLINELNIFLEEISLNGKYLQDPQIKSLDNIFRAIQRLERSRFDNKIDPLLTKLFDNIVKCICSTSFIEMFIHSTTQEIDDPGQKFLLHTCTDYIYSHPTDQQHKQCLLDIRQSLLHPFSQWLLQQRSSFRSWNIRMTVILRQLCFILTLSIQLNRYAILDKDTFNGYCQLIDSFIIILQSIIQTENMINNKLNQSLMGTLTPNLYTMTLSNQLEIYIKNKHITSLTLKLADIENDEIQLNAFRILSSIITEQDTKTMSNSITIANLFRKFLDKAIDDPNQMLKFYNLLRCLKHLIQYDQIKQELIKQNGVLLLLRCITETKFKPLQAQQPALEILLALTFTNEAYCVLKENVNHIKSLLSSPHQGVSRTVDSLLWRLKTQEEILLKPKPISNTYKYDVMISYSHSDKDLTYRIYDQLIKDDFRVWIDRDETFGTTMITKADIIDQSQYIIICISDEYKQNLYCRCEAYYAYERQCQIIPVVLTLNYHPDGWLTNIINRTNYIDFVLLDFPLAYKALKSELNQSLDSHPELEQISSCTTSEYLSTIEQWTTEDVKLFLIDNKFSCLLPIISEMNGYLLNDLYTMCKQNRESMFHTLKNELLTLDKNAQPLTLFIYLRFLNEIKKYISKAVVID